MDPSGSQTLQVQCESFPRLEPPQARAALRPHVPRRIGPVTMHIERGCERGWIAGIVFRNTRGEHLCEEVTRSYRCRISGDPGFGLSPIPRDPSGSSRAEHVSEESP
jgi:hypothetical protein